MAEVNIGRHLVIDCDHVPPSLLNDMETIRALINAVAASIGTLVLKEDYHAFSPAGITGFAIVSASHIAVHTWPEYGYVGIDVFSCRNIYPETVIEVVSRVMGSHHCRYRLLDRVAALPEDMTGKETPG